MGGILSSIQEFDKAVDYVKKNNLSIPALYTLSLDSVQTSLEFNITGNFVYVIDSADNDNSINVKFNASQGNAIPLKRQQGFRTPFDKIFISHDAQAGGSVTLIIGQLSSELMNVIDNRSAIQADLEAVRDELRGDTTPKDGGNRVQLATEAQVLAVNTSRKSFGVSVPSTNTGIIYLRFGSTTVTTSNYAIELQAGQAISFDDTRSEVRALSSVSGEYLHFWEL